MRHVLLDSQCARPEQHATAEAAIVAAAEQNQQFCAAVNLEAIRSRRIIAVSYTDSRFWAWLDDGRHLVISTVDRNGMTPAVSLEPTAEGAELHVRPEEPITLSFGRHSWQWDRKALAQMIVGRAVADTFHNGREFYLYLDKGLMIRFAQMKMLASGAPLLYWEFAD
jgi:hypothetical protein